MKVCTPQGKIQMPMQALKQLGLVCYSGRLCAPKIWFPSTKPVGKYNFNFFFLNDYQSNHISSSF